MIFASFSFEFFVVIASFTTIQNFNLLCSKLLKSNPKVFCPKALVLMYHISLINGCFSFVAHYSTRIATVICLSEGFFKGAELKSCISRGLIRGDQFKDLRYDVDGTS